MRFIRKEYDEDRDFLRIRDFLKNHYFRGDLPWNWGLERWNWARFHPMMFSQGDPEKTKANIRYWNEHVILWEDEAREVAAVISTETPMADGEWFFQRRPDADGLVSEMFLAAEEISLREGLKVMEIPIYDYDKVMVEMAETRGFHSEPDALWHNALLDLDDHTDELISEARLPGGFALGSMMDGDLSLRCRAQGLGFNHPDPGEWTTVKEYLQVQKAPDYRAELDLFVIAPSGEYASVCIIWFDDHNRIAFLEPVCTPPEYRRKGLGREVIYEAVRRVRRLGARKVYVGSSQEFYKAIGFDVIYLGRFWRKAL